MARRAKDTNQKLATYSLSLPARWREYFDGIDRMSQSAACRKIISWALDHGALQALGYVSPMPSDPAARAQVELIQQLAAGSAPTPGDLAPTLEPTAPYVPPPRPTVADLAAQRAADRAAVEALFGPDWDDQAPPVANAAALAAAFDPQAPTGPVIWHDDEPDDLEP